jgi:hypothetical protein
MKPSELKAAKQRALEYSEKKYSMSQRANPPISVVDADLATVAICCWHGGLIKTFGGKNGAVFFCPTGEQYWRYKKRDQTLWRALKFARRGIV